MPEGKIGSGEAAALKAATKRGQLRLAGECATRGRPDLLFGCLGSGPGIRSPQLLLQLVAEVREVLHGGGVDGVLDQVGRVIGRLAREQPSERQQLARLVGEGL